MLGNRRNLVFRVSIVINIAVLLYAAMHLSGATTMPVEWVTVEGSERTAEFRYINQNENRNDTEMRSLEPGIRNLEESSYTSQKTPLTSTTTNKTLSSTQSVAEIEKKLLNIVPSEPDTTNETLYETEDENTLWEPALTRLRSLIGCTDKEYLPVTSQRGEFWVLKNYVQADHGPLQCHETITYTTHASFEFLDNLQPLVERWMGPVSLAMHAPGTDIDPTVDSIRYLRDCSQNYLIKQFVTFHVFFSSKHVPAKIPDPSIFLKPYNCSIIPSYTDNNKTTYTKQKNLLYPVNVARNVARDAALTHFLLPSDIELYPSPYLIPRFLNMITRNGKPLNNSKLPRVFPISIFEVAANVQVPSTKTELQSMLANKTAIPFHKFVCPNCHNIPQGEQWKTAPETDQMDVFHVGKRKGKFVHWEPIFIGTHQDPYYDERLSWEGKQDKMTQGYILCVKDYDFMILNNAFLIHKPGIKHYVKNSKRDSIAGKQSRFIKNAIMPELKKLFGTRAGCAL